MDASNSLGPVLGRLLVKMPDLRGADFKVAFYLVTRVIVSGSADISMSERALSDATGLSKTTIQVALKRLEFSGLFLREHGSYNRPDRFLLPAFRPANGGSEIGTPVPKFGTLSGPEIGTLPGPEIGTPVPETGTLPGPENGTGGVENGTGGVENATPANKEHAHAGAHRVSIVGSSFVSIDRCLRQTTLDSDQAQEAAVLRSHLRSFCARVGSHTLEGAEVDEKIVAQCLSIAPLHALMQCLRELNGAKIGKPRTWAWFVSVFLERIHGFTPVEVATAREALKLKPKPPREESVDLAFVGGIKQALANGAKGIK